MSWEDKFQLWSKGPGDTEKEKCDNTERAVRDAIKKHPLFADRDVEVFAQGSFKNRTNVRADSDVDVCVLCNDSFFFDVPDGATIEDYGISTPADYPYSTFKDDVRKALKDHFGDSSVVDGNKAFKIRENTYRVEADVVACFDFHLYKGSFVPSHHGAAFKTKYGDRIVNWPDQNYVEAGIKNTATQRRFKRVTRILKKLCNEMSGEGIVSAQTTPSFLIECLMYNVPNQKLGNYNLSTDVRDSLAYLFNETRDIKDCAHWREVNDIAPLFASHQKWTRAGAHKFISDAWDYLGFE